MSSKLYGRAGIEAALTAVGERLAFESEPCVIVVAGGAAMNLLGIVDRPTIDVDVLARVREGTDALGPPDPMPEVLRRAIAAVARDRGLLEGWMNTAVADQWHFGLPPGLAERLEWPTYGALRVGVVDRKALICFKLYASADQTGPDNVHLRDLLALRPDDEERRSAAEWVRAQDPSPDFHAVVAKVLAYVENTLR